MTSTYASDILFDDFALLTQQFGHNRLMATSVNTNCDCAGSPSLSANCDGASAPTLNADCDCAGSPLTSRYDDHNTDQITQSAISAH